MRIAVLSCEGVEQSIEKEFTFYALIGNMNGLNEANTTEYQMQAEGYFEDKGKCRVRGVKPSKDDKSIMQWSFTLKSKKDTDGAVTEYTIPVDIEFARAFVKTACKDEIIKTRYTFFSKEANSKITILDKEYSYPSELLKTEVDVFEDNNGVANSYCKIDIEVQDLEKYLNDTYPDLRESNYNLRACVKVSELPIGLSDFKYPGIDKDWISEYWKKVKLPV